MPGLRWSQPLRVHRYRESAAGMDHRRQQLMLAFVAYMNLRRIEGEELQRRLMADMNSKLDKMVANGEAIPDITPERLIALEMERQAIEKERASERDGPEINF